jgi:hypothetical protein
MKYSKYYGVVKGNYIRNKKIIYLNKIKIKIEKFDNIQYNKYTNLTQNQFKFLLSKIKKN